MSATIGSRPTFGVPGASPLRGPGRSESDVRGQPRGMGGVIDAQAPATTAPPQRTNVAEISLGRAPDEADPRLWALLTRAERDFYFRNARFGTLTYGPEVTSSSERSETGRRVGRRVDLTA